MDLKNQLKNYILFSKETDTKKLISAFILESIKNDNYPSLEEISLHCFISKSSVVRFCQKMNFKGYCEFINRLKFENNLSNNYSSNFDINNNLWIDYNKRLNLWIEESNILYSSLLEVSKLIIEYQNIFLYFSDENSIATSPLNDILLLLNKNVVHSKNKRIVKLLNEPNNLRNLYIFIINSNDNFYFWEIENEITNSDSQKIIFNFSSSKVKINNSLILNLSSSNNYIYEIYENEQKLIYLFKQIFNQILNTSQSKNSV